MAYQTAGVGDLSRTLSMLYQYQYAINTLPIGIKAVYQSTARCSLDFTHRQTPVISFYRDAGTPLPQLTPQPLTGASSVSKLALSFAQQLMDKHVDPRAIQRWL